MSMPFEAIVEDIYYRFRSDHRVVPIATLQRMDNGAIYHLDIQAQTDNTMILGKGDQVSVCEILDAQGRPTNQTQLLRGPIQPRVQYMLVLNHCPYCGSELYRVPNTFGQCLSRACPAQSSPNIQQFLATIGVTFFGIDRILFYHLLTRGAIRSIADLFFINKEHLIELDNSLVRKPDMDAFLQLVHGMIPRLTLLNILLGMKIPGLDQNSIGLIDRTMQGQYAIFYAYLCGQRPDIMLPMEIVQQLDVFFSVENNMQIFYQLWFVLQSYTNYIPIPQHQVA